MTGRENIRVWQGACIVHSTFPARRLAKMKAAHPEALIAAHPECPQEVLRMADYIGSTSGIINWCTRVADRDEIIVMTESGVRRSLELKAPHRKFHFVDNENCNCSECPYMKLNTLEKLHACLRDLQPRVELPRDIIERARVPIERMLAVKL
jgi:quinolinate synthase